jgi:ADP-ribose pyrophosphatase YjhB (NUDIX family)/acyl carrier protein
MIKKQLRKMISEEFKIDQGEISEDKDLIKFCNIAPIDLLSLIVEIEDWFDIEIDDITITNIINYNTLSKLTVLVKSKISKVEYKNAASTASLIYLNKDHELLLVERKRNPFKGFWALPGGFLNCDKESLEEAAKREFFEETNLTITEFEMFNVNSEPDRDPRGHVIDHVYLVLSCEGELKAKDDAKNANFFKLSELPKLAFDHEKSIIKLTKSLTGLQEIVHRIRTMR